MNQIGLGPRGRMGMGDGIHRQALPEAVGGVARIKPAAAQRLLADQQVAGVDQGIAGALRQHAAGGGEPDAGVAQFDRQGHSRTCR
ncbi:MAG: hypothetical protein U5R48_08165 [Gammaproteobacteria bacterium]|nr:hypothetical protein [Gammaproteobacteria bacterium]